MKKYAHEITQHDIPRTIWICHSNRGAESVNLEIRSYLSYYRKNLNPGEILMIRRNSYYYNTWLLNGDLARVRDISDRSEAVDVVYNFRDEKNLVIKLVFRDAIISPLHESDVRLRVKILENGLIKNAASLQKIQAALHVYAMKRYKSEKPPVNFDMYRKGDVYFNSLHVGYGYAITCHKAQGGEWEQVIADMKHSLGPLSNGFRRWAYTAVTRASGRLLVLNPVKQADFLVDHTRFDPLRFRIDDTHSEVVSTIQSTVCDHLKLPKPVNG
ncbi:MAG: ATP-binding domain-containing protein, partial [Cyclonatronaceae bacterium]